MIRGIPHDLPRTIFEKASEHYYDNGTGHYVALHRIDFKGKLRVMALTYDRFEHEHRVELITLHPIKPYQKYGRIKSGRWKRA